jgi:hypothetical protein
MKVLITWISQKRFRLFFLLFSFAFCHPSFSQNVGIGNTSPNEKLDVNGNINVTGTIKANGTDGLPNQVLGKNESGTLSWTDFNYRHSATFSLGTGSWTVPAGITTVVAEIWGGGGGGNSVCGGGGGGYIKATFTVIPGTDLKYQVGGGGTGASFYGNAGIASYVSYGTSYAYGNPGGGAGYDGGTITHSSGVGGDFLATNITAGYEVSPGENGHTNVPDFLQTASHNDIESSSGGNGGNAGNTMYTGGKEFSIIFNETTYYFYRRVTGTPGKIPGGGGGAGYRLVLAGGYNEMGYIGGSGLIIFHY